MSTQYKQHLIAVGAIYEEPNASEEDAQTFDHCLKVDSLLEVAHRLNVNGLSLEVVKQFINEEQDVSDFYPDFDWTNAYEFLVHDCQEWLVYDALGPRDAKWTTIATPQSRARNLMYGYAALGPGVYECTDEQFDAYVCVAQNDIKVIQGDLSGMSLGPVSFSYCVENGCEIPSHVSLRLDGGDWSDFWDMPESNQFRKLCDDHPKVKAWENYNNLADIMLENMEVA